MSSGARLHIVYVSNLLVQLGSAHLLYVAGRHFRLSCSFEKETQPIFSEVASEILKFTSKSCCDLFQEKAQKIL